MFFTKRSRRVLAAVAESSDSSLLGFLWNHLEEVKEHWRSNFAFLDYYKKTLGRKEPLPKWTDADVEEFILQVPLYLLILSIFSLSAKAIFLLSLLPGGFCFDAVLSSGDELVADYRRSGFGLKI